MASAIACYAPSLIAYLQSLTVADCLQYWRNLAPGAIPDLLHSLLNYMLDDLFGPLLVQLLIRQAMGPLGSR